MDNCIEGLIALDRGIKGTVLCYIRYYGEIQFLFRQFRIQSSNSICFVFAADCRNNGVAREIPVSAKVFMGDYAESVTCDQEDNSVYARPENHFHQ